MLAATSAAMARASRVSPRIKTQRRGYCFRLRPPVVERLRKVATADQLSLTGFLERLIDDFLDFYGAGPLMRQALAADRAERRMAQREYLRLCIQGRHRGALRAR